MITSLDLRNFRCFKKVSVKLSPLTVIIGPNACGKSALLQAIVKLKEAPEKLPLSERWQCDLRFEPMIRVTADGTESFDWKPPHDDERRDAKTLTAYKNNLEMIRKKAPHVVLHRIPTEGPSLTTSGTNDADGIPSVGDNGDRISALLDYLLRKDRQRFDAIVAALRTLVPGLQLINITTPKPSDRGVEFVFMNGLTLAPSSVSTGVGLILFYTVLAHHPKPPDVILVEEPENGVHPRRLKDIVALLRGLTTGRYGARPVQVIITTHSPYLLDEIDPQTEKVLVCQRNEGTDAREVSELQLDQVESFLEDFGLGEIWSNREEKGLVGNG
jgi:predicted ATPase